MADGGSTVLVPICQMVGNVPICTYIPVDGSAGGSIPTWLFVGLIGLGVLILGSLVWMIWDTR